MSVTHSIWPAAIPIGRDAGRRIGPEPLTPPCAGVKLKHFGTTSPIFPQKKVFLCDECDP